MRKNVCYADILLRQNTIQIEEKAKPLRAFSFLLKS